MDDQPAPKRRWGQPPPPTEFEQQRGADMADARWATTHSLDEARDWLKKAHEARVDLITLELTKKPKDEMTAQEKADLRVQAAAVTDDDEIVIELRRLLAGSRRALEALRGRLR